MGRNHRRQDVCVPPVGDDSFVMAHDRRPTHVEPNATFLRLRKCLPRRSRHNCRAPTEHNSKPGNEIVASVVIENALYEKRDERRGYGSP